MYYSYQINILRSDSNMNKKHFKFEYLFTICTVFLLVAGCFPKLAQIAPEEQARLKNYPQIKIIHYNSPDFKVTTPEEALWVPFGLIGLGGILSSEYSTGNNIVRDYNLKDPVFQVENHFLSILQSDLGFTNIRSIDDPFKSDDLK